MHQLPPSAMSRRTLLGSLCLGLGLVQIHARSAGSQGTGPYTFAVIGTDKRTPADPELSDILMVSRVDVTAGTVRTLSIPRDLYVEIPGHGSAKINAAFNIAVKADPEQNWAIGAAATVATIEHNFGLVIDGVALTDMGVFPQIVDAVGGITVINPYAFTDDVYHMTSFPAGTLHLDGARALVFVRVRVPDGDGGRVMRQHLVLQAILVKLQDPAMLLRMPELIATLQDVVRTTIPADILPTLIAMIPQLSSEDLAFTNIDHLLTSGYTEDGQWIYQGDWSMLPDYVENWLAGNGE